jgi:hypothetical protein
MNAKLAVLILSETPYEGSLLQDLFLSLLYFIDPKVLSQLLHIIKVIKVERFLRKCALHDSFALS